VWTLWSTRTDGSVSQTRGARTADHEIAKGSWRRTPLLGPFMQVSSLFCAPVWPSGATRLAVRAPLQSHIRAGSGRRHGEGFGALTSGRKAAEICARRTSQHDGDGDEQAIDRVLRLFFIAAVTAAIGALTFSQGDLSAVPLVGIEEGIIGLE